jgi:hypothetical protein
MMQQGQSSVSRPQESYLLDETEKRVHEMRSDIADLVDRVRIIADRLFGAQPREIQTGQADKAQGHRPALESLNKAQDEAQEAIHNLRHEVGRLEVL